LGKEVFDTDGDAVEALPLPSTPFPFQSKTNYKSILGSTLVLALAQEEIRNMHLYQIERDMP
jgi:hypothetical protein